MLHGVGVPLAPISTFRKGFVDRLKPYTCVSQLNRATNPCSMNPCLIDTTKKGAVTPNIMNLVFSPVLHFFLPVKCVLLFTVMEISEEGDSGDSAVQ